MNQRFKAGFLSMPLIGWGILREWWVLGLVLAVLVELPHFIKGRKDFKASDFSRAFTLSWLLLGVVAAVLWIQDVERAGYEILVESLPLFFLPVMLCQLFGKTPDYPLHVTTLFSGIRYKVELKRGENPKEWRMNFGIIYLVLILVATSWNLNQLEFKAGYAALVIGVLWRFVFCFHPASRPRNRWKGQVTYLLSVAIALLAGVGLIQLYKYLESGKWLNYQYTDSPHQSGTALGSLEKIKLDSEIHWRIISPTQPPPALLRDRVFNRYVNRSWYHRPLEDVLSKDDFRDYSLTPYEGGYGYFPEGLEKSEASQRKVQEFRLRGKGYQKTLLPVTDASLIFKTTSLEAITCNSLGTVVGENPVTGVVDYVLSSGKSSDRDYIEGAPNAELDLDVPEDMNPGLEKFITMSKILKVGDLSSLSRQLKTVFHEDFSYTIDAQISREKPVDDFLNSAKQGHCEYFATAGVLLLRKLGIPARYVVGYAVKDYDADQDEWVMRGFHVHAWVRAWDAAQSRWVNVDFTPPSDVLFAHKKKPFHQSFQDAVKRWREDFIVWRSENEESWVFTVLPGFLVVLLIAVFGRNLLKARSANGSETDIDRLMSPLARRLKQPFRAPSQTYRSWVSALPLSDQVGSRLTLLVEAMIYGPSPDEKQLKKEIKLLIKSVPKK